MIYLDYAATTPVDERVLRVMRPFFSEIFGNPSSAHRFGQRAEAAVETARETVAGVLNCRPDEIIFTAGGTEADNLALRGVMLAEMESGRNRLLTARTEHAAVSKTAEHLEKYAGVQVTWLTVDEFGQVRPEHVAGALREDAALVSVMFANNEVGTVNPIAALAPLCRERRVLFHSDAVQAAGYLDVDVQKLGVDLLALGGHKLYGPKGVGALFVRHGTGLVPSLTGGGQETGRRAGTHNVPYIVGFAEALRLAKEERQERIAHVQPLRDYVIARVLQEIPEARLSGHPEQRLPNHASFVFRDADGNLLVQLLDAAGFACSSGSACKTGRPEPSEVLLAMGFTPAWARGSLRVTLGLGTTPEQVEAFLAVLPSLVERARRLHKEKTRS
jgi:cysteine desulfurase